MKHVNGGYYTLEFTPEDIDELDLEYSQEKTINIEEFKEQKFIKRLLEITYVNENGRYKRTDKPILIKCNNGDSRFLNVFDSCIFSEYIQILGWDSFIDGSTPISYVPLLCIKLTINSITIFVTTF